MPFISIQSSYRQLLTAPSAPDNIFTAGGARSGSENTPIYLTANSDYQVTSFQHGTHTDGESLFAPDSPIVLADTTYQIRSMRYKDNYWYAILNGTGFPSVPYIARSETGLAGTFEGIRPLPVEETSGWNDNSNTGRTRAVWADDQNKLLVMGTNKLALCTGDPMDTSNWQVVNYTIDDPDIRTPRSWHYPSYFEGKFIIARFTNGVVANETWRYGFSTNGINWEWSANLPGSDGMRFLPNTQWERVQNGRIVVGGIGIIASPDHYSGAAYSDDDGLTWTSATVPTTLVPAETIETGGTHMVTIDNTIYLLTQNAMAQPEADNSARCYLCRSTDNGTTYEFVGRFPNFFGFQHARLTYSSTHGWALIGRIPTVDANPTGGTRLYVHPPGHITPVGVNPGDPGEFLSWNYYELGSEFTPRPYMGGNWVIGAAYWDSNISGGFLS